MRQHRAELAQQSGNRGSEPRRVRVLLIDSSPHDAALMAIALGEQGYEVRLAAEGLLGLGVLSLEGDPPDVVILEALLPDADGVDLCHRIRLVSRVPILMLSTRFEETQIVRGLVAGADDVLPRTVGLDELLARLEAVLRRSRLSDVAANSLPMHDLAINAARRTVVRRGREVRLSRHEYRLLSHLALNAGMVLTRDDLLTRVWGSAEAARSSQLRATVKRLRSKLEDNPASPRYVLTLRGVGYMFAALRSP